MQRQPPTPVCKAFTVCRQIFHDNITEEHTIVAPLHQIFVPRLPVTMDLSAFARWTNAHGQYRVELQLRTLDGDVLWNKEMDNPFEIRDPLLIVGVTLRHLAVTFPKAGKFEFALMANGEDVATDVFLVHQRDG